MPALKTDKVIKALNKKGFVMQKGRTDHLRFVFYADGYPANIKTHLSHNSQDLGNDLQAYMAEQLHLSKAEFVEMVSCKIGHDELIDKYSELGLLKT